MYQPLKLLDFLFIVEQKCAYQDLDFKDQDAYHLMLLTHDNILIAYTRLLPPEISYKDYSSIGRVITHSNYRTQGIGKDIMLKSIYYLDILFPHYNIKISAQSYLLKFYETFSFFTDGIEYLEDDIPHTAMIRHSTHFEPQSKSY